MAFGFLASFRKMRSAVLLLRDLSYQNLGPLLLVEKFDQNILNCIVVG